MLPRISNLFPSRSFYKPTTNRENTDGKEFNRLVNEKVRIMELNAEKVFNLYRKPQLDFFSQKGKLVDGMVFVPGRGIVPRHVPGYRNVYVRVVVNGKLIEFTGIKNPESGEYLYKDVRVKNIPPWWKWSHEHIAVSRLDEKNMGYFIDFNNGLRGTTKFLSIEIERNPKEAFDYILDAFEYLKEEGYDVKEDLNKLFKELSEKGEKEELISWIDENKERINAILGKANQRENNRSSSGA